MQVSARVANELGAGDGLRARGAARASAVLVVAVMLVFSAGVLAVRHVYGACAGHTWRACWRSGMYAVHVTGIHMGRAVRAMPP